MGAWAFATRYLAQNRCSATRYLNAATGSSRERWRCIKIRRRRCLGGRGRDCQRCEKALNNRAPSRRSGRYLSADTMPWWPRHRRGVRPGGRGDPPAKRNEDLQQLGAHVLLGVSAGQGGARRPHRERESPGPREPAPAVTTPPTPGSAVEAGVGQVRHRHQGESNPAGGLTLMPLRVQGLA